MNKKALSDVITNVLIILLVIVAVGIIAAFLVPLLKGTTDKAQSANTCLTVGVLVKKCEVAQNGANDYNVSVLISRGVGKTEVSEAKIILEKDDGGSNITSFSSPNSLTEYASLSHSLARINFKPKTASVAVKLAGANSACDASEIISCKMVSSVSGGSSGTTTTTPPAPFLNVLYLGQIADRTGPWSFNPGSGNDFSFSLNFNNPTSFGINKIVLSHNFVGEAWDTQNSGSYPIVLFNSVNNQINTAYTNTLMTVPSGTQNYGAYIQPVHTPFEGALLRLYLSNGTIYDYNIPKP
jgi:hypothetical protein